MPETVYPARTWCTFDAERDELTVVQDGVDGILVVTMPAGEVLAGIPGERIVEALYLARPVSD